MRSRALIIDGWQRVGNAMRLLELIPHHPLRMFVTVHFGTDAVWERHRFTELNKNVRKVSPNLHLRNMRDTNAAVLTLFGLSNNTKDFPLYKKVCWGQAMQRGQLLTALTLCKAANTLHAHKGGISKTGATAHVADAAKRAADNVALKNFRQNVTTLISAIMPIGLPHTVAHDPLPLVFVTPHLFALPARRARQSGLPRCPLSWRARPYLPSPCRRETPRQDRVYLRRS